MIKYDMINTETIMDCYHLIQYGEQVANTAMYGADNDIVVTDEIYDYCLLQSQKLHQSAHYAEISDIATDLETDLEALHGKSKVDFIAYLHSPQTHRK